MRRNKKYAGTSYGTNAQERTVNIYMQDLTAENLIKETVSMVISAGTCIK